MQIGTICGPQNPSKIGFKWCNTLIGFADPLEIHGPTVKNLCPRGIYSQNDCLGCNIFVMLFYETFFSIYVIWIHDKKKKNWNSNICDWLPCYVWHGNSAEATSDFLNLAEEGVCSISVIGQNGFIGEERFAGWADLPFLHNHVLRSNQ